MEATALALRKCSFTLTSSTSITERKKNIEIFVELLREPRTHQYLDEQTDHDGEKKSKSSLTWNDLFDIIRDFTVDELKNIRSKPPAKTSMIETKYQESLKLFRVIVENANSRGAQLDARSLVESIVSILTDEYWSTCSIIVKELSHLLINNVVNLHQYTNELRENEWIDLCVLYMSLTKKSELDQAFYSSSLKMIAEKSIIYHDFDTIDMKFRQEVFNFLRIQFDDLKNSTHFSVIENFLCILNSWTSKFLFDMPDEIFGLANDLLPCLLNIWRKKCNDRTKNEILKFIRLEIQIHHPNHRKYQSDDNWTKILDDLNDLILREIDDFISKQRPNSRNEQTEFSLRFDLLSLASEVFYQIGEKILEENDEFVPPTAKRIRSEFSTTNHREMNSFDNLFRSSDPQHQSIGFQIVSFQIENQMKISSIRCEFYLEILRRFLNEERRPSLLINAFRCFASLRSIVAKENFPQIDFRPFLHFSLCENSLIDLLKIEELNWSILSSTKSLRKIFQFIQTNSIDDEEKFLEKFLPDLSTIYEKNNENLSTFFSSPSVDCASMFASILMQMSSFDLLPCRIHSTQTSIDPIETEWLRLKYFSPFDVKQNESIESNFHSKTNFCQLNSKMFKQIVEIYVKNLRFLRQIVDRPTGERCPLFLHWFFLGVHMLKIIEEYFRLELFDEEILSIFINEIQKLFNDFTDELTNLRDISFLDDLLEYFRQLFDFSSSSKLIKSISNECRQIPSPIFAFVHLDFAKTFYKLSFDADENKSMKSLEILLLLCFQSIFDQTNESNSMFNKFVPKFRSTINSFNRLLEEKLFENLNDLPLPSSSSFSYFDRFFSTLFQFDLTKLRLNFFEFLCQSFSELFRNFHRDRIFCSKLLDDFQRFLRQISTEFNDHSQWKHLKNLFDAFWQMIIGEKSSFNSNLRRKIVEIKEIFLDLDDLKPNEICRLINDSSYFVRCQSIRLSSFLFIEQKSLRLKSSIEQKKIFDFLVEKTSSSPSFVHLLCHLTNQSEYLSRRAASFLIQFALSNENLQHLLPSKVPIEYFLSTWKNSFDEFPWRFFPSTSIEQFRSFCFSIKNFSSSTIDNKIMLNEYFAEFYAFVLPNSINEKILTKNETQRLIKQKLTSLIVHLLLSYEGDERSESQSNDPWKPEPIGPTKSWPMLRQIFEQLRQMTNAKSFLELLLKNAEIAEILLRLSSKIYWNTSIHDQFRLLDVFSLFIREILLIKLDYNYLHSIFRDSIQFLLRFISKINEQISTNELKEKLVELVCQLIDDLCSKAFEFDAETFRFQLIDVVRIFLRHQQNLTIDRIRPIFRRIYANIRTIDEIQMNFLSFLIENFLGEETRRISTKNFFVFYADRRSTIDDEFILKLFLQHLENEREHSLSNVDSNLIFIVKEKFLRVINEKFVGQILAKFPLFSSNIDESIDEIFDSTPIWIFNELILNDLIDENQNVVELTRSTLKNLFLLPIGEELFRENQHERLVEIYSIPFLNIIETPQTIKSNETTTNLWTIDTTNSFDRWLKSLMNFLFKQIEFYYEEKNENGHPFAKIFLQLKILIEFKIDLATKLFPHLIYSILLLPNKFNLRRNLSKNFSRLIDELLEKNTSICLPISQLIFRTIHFLRQCPNETSNKRNSTKNSFLNFENHFWLDIDYFQLAKCASKYRSFSSALIFADIWTTKQRSNIFTNQLYQSDIEMFSSTDLIDVFVRIHSQRNQSDEFYGLEKHLENRSDLFGEVSLLNNSPFDAIFYFDRAATQKSIDRTQILQSLRLAGFNHILQEYFNRISSCSNEMFYRIELSTILTQPNRLTKWTKVDDENSIRENLLSILQRPTNDRIPFEFDEKLWSNVKNLRECSLLNVFDDIAKNFQNPTRLSTIWNCHEEISSKLIDFDRIDELLLTRIAATETFFGKRNENLISELVTQLCENALNSNKLQLCDRYLNDLTPLIDENLTHNLSFLRAKLLVRRQQETAGEYLRQLINSSVPNSIQIRSRLLLCDWLSETRCETSSTIKEQLDLIAESVSKLDTNDLQLIFDSYLSMAKFSDNEYQRLNQLIQSPIFENKRLLIARNQIEFEKQEKIDPTGRYTKNLKRSLDMDKTEMDEQKKLQDRYLILTLQNYLVCLKLNSNLTKRKETKSMEKSPPEIMLTSKCLSYWLTNSTNDDVNRTLKKFLTQIPTYFFLPFVYQMAARMSLTNEKNPLTFHKILLEYLSKCLIDHPNHVLPVIFALANAHKDAHINNQQTSGTTTTTTKKPTNGPGLIALNNEMSNDSRSQAAHFLLEQCSKVKTNLVHQMRLLNDAYIEAAYWDAPSLKSDPQNKSPTFSKSLRLMHIKDFHEVAIPTVTIPIATDGVYRNIETVKNFQSEYTMVGGVNAPKKLICHSSSGRSYPQLLKGKDDLRQDAVMQQLFTVVNRLLEKDNLTSDRSLRIRTYKVVPLTQKSGVLEWCERTITFGDYLTKDPDGAHSRYHSDDWTAMECRRHIHKIPHTDTAARRQAFNQICSKLRPVFRYFFYEYFHQPTLWHKSKQAYAKSVATSSIVGYIVGLGDRHVQNILIDTQTAEVIHIDLGVAFDQGKMLPIPEKIPFRLTRDIIDGLGICGTQGLFRKTCEITLELMRHYADTLITIIEVFLYDPLYQWQLSPQKALQLQQQLDKLNNDTVLSGTRRLSGKVATSSSSSSIVQFNGTNEITTQTDTNKMAERLLLGLRQKLQGVERFSQMTIKAHVNMLIQEATSIDNLSQLFAGWQPYL